MTTDKFSAGYVCDDQHSLSAGYPPRWVVMTEDSVIRLVSTLHGGVITTLLPLATSTGAVDRVVDMVHDIINEKIFVAIRSGKVVVYDTQSNPCRYFALLLL